MSDGTTHYAGCIQAGPKHYECALQEVGRLRGTITHLRAELEKETQRRFDGNEIASKEHREEVAAFMKMGDRLIEERKVAAKAAKAEYERGFDDGFILRKEKDGKRTWVGLTDIEAADCWSTSAVTTWENFEAKLKEKNT